MNYSTAILILKPEARCIKVIYEPDTELKKQTREMFKTFDKSLKVDDFVVVPSGTRFNITVCKIVAVDVDDWMETLDELRWVIGRVDMADANKVKAWEGAAIQELKDSEKRKLRRDMQANMTAAMDEKEKENLALMLASPIGAAHESPVVEAPKEEDKVA